MAIMSFAFLLVPIIFLFLPVWLFLLPLSRAYLAGLAFVRDPAIRVTPLDPWVAFNQTVRRKLRRIRITWSVVFGLVVSGSLIVYSNSIYSDRHVSVSSFSLLVPVEFLCFFTTLQLCCAFCAPRCSKTWTLVALTLASWVLVKILLVPLNWFAFIPFGNIGQYILIFGLYVYYWRRHLRRNGRWFRFEE